MNRLCLRCWPLAEEQLDWKVIGNQSLRSASASQLELKPKSCLARGSFLARLFASSEPRCGTRKLRFASKAPQIFKKVRGLEKSRRPSLDGFVATLLRDGKIQ